MSELSWVELMGRHAASAALYVSGAMNYLDAEGQRQQTTRSAEAAAYAKPNGAEVESLA